MLAVKEAGEAVDCDGCQRVVGDVPEGTRGHQQAQRHDPGCHKASQLRLAADLGPNLCTHASGSCFEIYF